MATDEEEETEYGTELYGDLKKLRKSVSECNSEITYLLNRFRKVEIEQGDYFPKQLSDEIETLSNKFKNECKCIGKNIT